MHKILEFWPKKMAMAHMQIKIYSTTLVIKEVPTKTTKRCHYTTIKMIKIEKIQCTKWQTEEKEFSYLAGENFKWYNYF